jgi:uncharacterized protein (TIGR02996 family)
VLLDELLAAWRESHDPALEDAIARLGEEHARAQPPLVGKTKAAIEAAWHALAKSGDARDLDRLLDTPWPKRGAEIETRLAVLGDWVADPRIGWKVLRVLEQTPRAHDDAFDRVLARSPSKRLAELLEGYNEMRFPRARTALLYIRRKRADPALLARIPLVETRAPHELELASLAEPDDLALRRVLADALQEAGDPRGELIALQLAIADGTADRRAPARVEELLAAHLDRWIGVLPNVMPASARFVRGFLVALTTTARGHVLDASIDLPAWRVVEELTLDGRDADVGALLHRMPRLRLLVTRDEILARLAQAGPFRGIRAIGTPTRWIDGVREAFPDLRVIAGQWALRWEAGSVRRQLRALHVQSAAHSLDALVHLKISLGDVRDVLAEREFGPRETRFTLTLADERGWVVAIERDGPCASLFWGGGPPTSRDQVETLLVDLAEAGITAVRVFDEPRARAAVEYTLRNRKKRLVGCTVTFDGAPFDLSAPITAASR